MVKGKRYRKSFRKGKETANGLCLEFRRGGERLRYLELPPHYEYYVSRRNSF